MRLVPLFLLATLPLAAQVPAQKWSFGLHGLPTSLEGHFEGTQDGNSIALDLKKDLALERDKTQPGVSLEYQGHRFGISLSTDAQDYLGSAILTRKVEIDGKTYEAGTLVHSQVKMKSYDLNWTIRALNWEQAWIGVDLGAHVWDLDLKAWGEINGTPTTAAQKIPVPIPQVGLSVGGKALGDRLVGRISFHFLRYKGASYHRWQGDLRYFPLPWLGLRAFLDDENCDVPKGSIQDDLLLNIQRTGAGFGVVVRF